MNNNYWLSVYQNFWVVSLSVCVFVLFVYLYICVTMSVCMSFCFFLFGVCHGCLYISIFYVSCLFVCFIWFICLYFCNYIYLCLFCYGVCDLSRFVWPYVSQSYLYNPSSLLRLDILFLCLNVNYVSLYMLWLLVFVNIIQTCWCSNLPYYACFYMFMSIFSVCFYLYMGLGMSYVSIICL